MTWAKIKSPILNLRRHPGAPLLRCILKAVSENTLLYVFHGAPGDQPTTRFQESHLSVSVLWFVLQITSRVLYITKELKERHIDRWLVWENHVVFTAIVTWPNPALFLQSIWCTRSCQYPLDGVCAHTHACAGGNCECMLLLPLVIQLLIEQR